ncbi:MAG: Crp/Fnr family transcriptional regulator, partial [Candidatus Melainabacteria bacterium HGW-Melainabacteria-1]
MSDGVELLKASYLFRDLPDKVLEQVAQRLVYDTFGPREVVFREGSEGDTLYLLSKGSVEIRKKDRDSGIEFHLTRLEAPAAFGEIALLKSDPRTATVATL